MAELRHRWLGDYDLDRQIDTKEPSKVLDKGAVILMATGPEYTVQTFEPDTSRIRVVLYAGVTESTITALATAVHAEQCMLFHWRGVSGNTQRNFMGAIWGSKEAVNTLKR